MHPSGDFCGLLRAAAGAAAPFFAWQDPRGDTFVAAAIEGACSQIHELGLRRARAPSKALLWRPFDAQRRLASSPAGRVDWMSAAWDGLLGLNAARFTVSAPDASSTGLADRLGASGDKSAGFRAEAAESGIRYQERVAAAVQACREGALRKVVLARHETWRAPTGAVVDIPATVDALRAADPSAIVFVLGDGQGRAFLGATPEVLVRVNNGVARTHALAGTRPHDAGGHEEHGLMGSAKDREEHLHVVEDIRRRLSAVCTDVVTATAPRPVRAATVQHLETPLHGQLLAGVRAADVAAQLHPTPAVCGSPRAGAREYLQRHEAWDRGLYAGYVGWQDDDGQGVAAVAIRSMLVDGDRVALFAGGGVVAASIPAREWQETRWKMAVARRALRWRPVACGGDRA